MIGLYGIAFWLPTIIKGFGIKSYLGVGLITAIPYGVATVGMILLSRSSDRTGERRMHYVFNVAAGGTRPDTERCVFLQSYIVCDLPVDRHTRRPGIDAPVLAYSFRLFDGTAAAAGIGIVNSIGNLGGYVGPNVPVWAKFFSSDPSASLYIIAFVLFLGGFLVFAFIPKSVNVKLFASSNVSVDIQRE